MSCSSRSRRVPRHDEPAGLREGAVEAACRVADAAGRCGRSRAAFAGAAAGARTTSSSRAAIRYYHDDIRRAGELKTKGIHYVDVGVSGGVWGLERGYCHMIGGEDAIVKHLDPIFRSLAPGVETAPRTPGATGQPSQAEYGYLHCGPNGAGHFVKMIHNGIEYGMMAAFAEGFNIIKNANIGLHTHEVDAETTPLREPDHYKYEIDVAQVAELWRRGSVVGSWLLDLTAGALRMDPGSGELRRSRLGFRRRPLDAACRDRRRRARTGDQRGALLTVRIRAAMPTMPIASCRRCASRSAAMWRSRRRRRVLDVRKSSDAIVFFGATGDLAYKQIFPSLLGLVRDEGLNVPIIGVAKAGWNLDQLKARAADSLKHHGGGDAPAVQRLMGLLRYVDGDYNDAATFTELRQQLGKAQRPLHYLAVPPSLFATVAEALAKSGCADNARLVIEKPFGHNRDDRSHAQQPARAILPRGEHLPDRPLPRQGAGAEHRLHAVRQLHVRAAMEPRSRQQHPDHHGRGFRCAGSRPVLRRDRSDPRRGAEPHASGPGATHDGSADRRGARGDARPEGRAAEGDAPVRSRACGAGTVRRLSVRARRSRRVRRSKRSWR